MPLIQLIADGDEIPFDAAGMRTIRYDLGDPDRIDETVSEVVEHAKTGAAGGCARHSYSITLDVASLRSSGDLLARSVVEIVQMLRDIREDMRPRAQFGYFTSAGAPSISLESLSPTYNTAGTTIAWTVPGDEPTPVIMVPPGYGISSESAASSDDEEAVSPTNDEEP